MTREVEMHSRRRSSLQTPGTPYTHLQEVQAAAAVVEEIEAATGVNSGAQEVELLKKPLLEPVASGNPHQWWDQITLRGIVTGAVLGTLFCIIIHKLALTTGIVPSLNVSAGLLGFFFVKSWTALLHKMGFLQKPFSRQENTVIQTCIVACYGVAYSGGFSTYLIAMDQTTYDLVNTSTQSQSYSFSDVKDPGLGWIMGYLLAVSFLGLVAVLPLRKVMIVDYKLSYPSGTATAVLINSFHTPHGFKQAQKQILCLGKYFAISFFLSLFKWHFSGPQDACGFDHFPSLGLKAYDKKFYFDFNMTYVGSGMICPHLVNFSLIFGGVLSWALLWPLLSCYAGDWYPSTAGDSDMKGLYGYKVFIAISLILGDGLYHFMKVSFMTISALYYQHRKEVGQLLPVATADGTQELLSTDEDIRNQVFLQDVISYKIAAYSYVGLAVLSTVVLPLLFDQMRWYYVFLSCCVGPILGFCNAYACGMTDWSLISSYGKISLFVFSSWAGSNGGVIVGLVSCGVMMVIVSTAAYLMQDFKTGYLTLTSPKSMFVSQVLGTFVGCIVAPLTFWIFWTAFAVGKQDGQYPAPNAVIFREMALLGIQGFSSLPKHCLDLSLSFFALSIVINFVRDKLPTRLSRFIPIPMAMALPFYIGPYFAIDMCVGSILVFGWQTLNRSKADLYIPAIASGLMCGDGVWTLISAVLALLKWQAPICMYFIDSDSYKSSSLLS